MSYPLKYIPSHLRRRQLPNTLDDTSRQLQSASDPACPPSGKFTHTDLLRIFDTPHLCSLAFFTLPSSDSTSYETYNKKKDRPSFQFNHDNGKLMKIVGYPPDKHPLNHLINFIVVFEGAHPDWLEKNELWLHTHSKELIEDYGKD
ncbi:hypothetical protein L486_04113 [Kwoniella mangroviensis CBS 10435]|uniref:Uncharacterized protein n=1 Tax=Kwoniella mangroviensis CBS 10435 TaxID=1331196 RepID=A0A1B9IRP4_9TREE|nr:uncharacterized protein I203_02799 [Kwoniella mangroviensis CBS 8507]OCF58084.1 hypothetical protein L486_04113 [Kwoniella mangroviensis CBS 10435]OCF68138.1 hypothetical protein I203_02799 [Kwoniella mangroviensis CBS 8507]